MWVFQQPHKDKPSEGDILYKFYLKCVRNYSNSWFLMYVRVHLLSNGYYAYLHLADSEIESLTGLLWLIKFFFYFH